MKEVYDNVTSSTMKSFSYINLQRNLINDKNPTQEIFEKATPKRAHWCMGLKHMVVQTMQ